MGIYKVCLYKDGNKNYPYVISGIHANNEKNASIKAKEQIAHIGYWEMEDVNIEERMKRLTIGYIVDDNM